MISDSMHGEQRFFKLISIYKNQKKIAHEEPNEHAHRHA